MNGTELLQFFWNVFDGGLLRLNDSDLSRPSPLFFEVDLEVKVTQGGLSSRSRALAGGVGPQDLVDQGLDSEGDKLFAEVLRPAHHVSYSIAACRLKYTHKVAS